MPETRDPGYEAMAARIAELEAELGAAREREAAVAGVLQIISSSPSQMALALSAISRSAALLCQADVCDLWLVDGQEVIPSASYGDPDIHTVPIGTRRHYRGMLAEAAIDQGRAVVIDDLATSGLGTEASIRARRIAETGRRSAAFLPLKQGDRVIGVLSLWRREQRAFTESQLSLVQTFADQAVIAIENSRLLDELQERNREVSEALEQQTAVADVLSIVAASVGDIQQALDAVVDRASKLIGAATATVWMPEGGALRSRAHHIHPDAPIGLHELVTRPIDVTADSPIADSFRTGNPFRFEGTMAEYHRERPAAAARVGATSGYGDPDARLAFIAQPLVGGGGVVGILVVEKLGGEAFGDHEVRLLETFADQAVIAIENARLFNELQHRNVEVTEALRRQTAMAEVLEVISSSPTSIQPVLDAIVVRAAELCQAEHCVYYNIEDDSTVIVAQHARTGELARYPATGTKNPLRDRIVGEAVAKQATSQVAITVAELNERYPAAQNNIALDEQDFITTLSVPIVRDGVVTSVLQMHKFNAGTFSDGEVELVEAFADQAVIAIENARLFNELQERNQQVSEALERQGATAEVMAVVGASASDSQPVFDAIVQRSLSLFSAHVAFVALKNNDQFTVAAFGGATANQFVDSVVGQSGPLYRDHYIGSTILNGREFSFSGSVEEFRGAFPKDALTFQMWERLSPGHAAGSVFVAPLTRQGEVIGALGALRTAESSPPSFGTEEIALVRTFADQAVIAMENARLFRELHEALEQQTAVSGVLAAISSAATNLDEVLQTIANAATQLLDGDLGVINRTRFEGDELVTDHTFVTDPSDLDYYQARRNLLRPFPEGSLQGDAIRGRATLQANGTPDDIEATFPDTARFWRERGRLTAQSAIATPLLTEDRAIGALTVVRRNGVRPYTDGDVRLLQTFADQAVIAIENARLFREQQEALDRQTAMAEVLEIISRSATDAQPVLDAIVEKAARLTGAADANVFFRDGEVAREAARFDPTGMIAGAPAELPVVQTSIVGRAFLTSEVQHLSGTIAAWSERFPYEAPLLRELGHDDFTGLAAPLVRDGETIGCLTMDRPGVRPFSTEQIALIEAFADQAVIAIENARLFNELQERNREVSEALDVQTVLAEVLRIVAAAPSDIDAALPEIAAAAEKLCDANFSSVVFWEDGQYRMWNRFAGSLVGRPDPASREQRSFVSAAIEENRVVEVYGPVESWEAEYPGAAANNRLRDWAGGGVLAVPIGLSEGRAGAILVTRDTETPFEPRHIALLKTLGDQAVIAIENARLFNELQERNREVSEALEQQTAVAGVLQTISQSVFDLDAVLNTLAEQAGRLLVAPTVLVQLLSEGELTVVAGTGLHDATRAWWSSEAGQEWVTGIISERAPRISIDRAEGKVDPIDKAVWAEAGVPSASTLVVPLLKGGSETGAIVVIRTGEEGYSPSEIRLLQTFADQAVIAIENARLFNELQERNREVSEALDHQTAMAEVLSIIGRSTQDAQPVLDAVAERAASLCDADECLFLLVDGTFTRPVARHIRVGAPLAPYPDEAASIVGRSLARAVTHQEVVHFAGTIAELEAAYPRAPQFARPFATDRIAILSLPVIRESETIGIIQTIRGDGKPFSTEQVKLVQAFADQAVIAIENARLFNELQERNREVSEALRREEATGEILQQISRAPEELSNTLDAIALAARRLCASQGAGFWMREGEEVISYVTLEEGSFGGLPPDALNSRLRISDFPAQFVDQRSRKGAINIVDLSESEGFTEEQRERARATFQHSQVHAPVLVGDEPVGMLVVSRDHVEPFGQSEMTLLESLADQAGIAVSNARLLSQLRERNREVSEALEQQTATAEVMAVVGSSASDARPVFQAIVERVGPLFQADTAGVYLREGDLLYPQALYSRIVSVSELADIATEPVGPSVDVFRTGEPSWFFGSVEDYANAYPLDGHMINAWRSSYPENMGATLTYPLRVAGTVAGLLWVVRKDHAFADADLAVVKTFADQAVIAIENARLFSELQERNREVSEALMREKASAEILRQISETPDDLEATLGAIGEAIRAATDTGTISWWFPVEGGFSGHIGGVDPARTIPTLDDATNREIAFVPASEAPSLSVVAEERRVVAVADVLRQAEDEVPSVIKALASEMGVTPAEFYVRVGIRSSVWVPVLREGRVVAILNGTSPNANAFTPEAVAVLEGFADQASIAIANAQLLGELRERNREVSEALGREEATGEILRQITRAPEDLDGTLRTIGEVVRDALGVTATSWWFADAGGFTQFVGGVGAGAGPAYANEAPRYAARPEHVPWVSAAAVNKAPMVVPDTTEVPEDEQPLVVRQLATANALSVGEWWEQQAGGRSYVAVPVIREHEVVGVLDALRAEAGGFAAAEIALLETLADQAAIAIENARLLRELRERNREVSEALRRQTAMAEVLEIISKSPTNVQPVLDAVAKRAAALTAGERAFVIAVEDGLAWPLSQFAADNVAEAFYPPEPTPITGRIIETTITSGRTTTFCGVLEDFERLYPSGVRYAREMTENEFTIVGVPLIRGDEAIGTLQVTRSNLIPFSEQEIALLEAFADQAVIAIENARLFNELQDRNREVSEALEREQTTGEILRQITRAPEQLRETLNAIGEAVRASLRAGATNWWFVTDQGIIATGGGYRPDVVEDIPADYTAQIMSLAEAPDASWETSHTWVAQTMGNRRPTRIDDTLALADEENPPVVRRMASEMGVTCREYWRIVRAGTYAVVPLLLEDRVLGALDISRPEPGGFSDAEMALVESFADQAAIAIENARLLRELRERNRAVTEALHREEATSEILGLISSAPEDLDRTLQALTDACTRLTGMGSTVSLPEGEDLVVRGQSLAPGDGMASVLGHRSSIAESMSVGLAFRSGQPVILHESDLDSVARERVAAMGLRALAAVPILQGDTALGVLTVGNSSGAEITRETVTLIESFADQAAIAIENARLLRELRERTAELEVASRHKSEFLANMSHELRTPLNAIIGYSELLQEEAADLGDDDYVPDLKKIHTAGRHLLTLISGILDLSKIEAGRMTMYLEDFDIATLVNDTRDIIQPLVERNRNRLEVSCPDGIGTMHADLVKLRQVLFNLLSNAAKFTEDGVVSLSVTREGEEVLFAIADTGIGITEEQRERLFEAFSQADAAVSQKYGGTGLGLALSRSFCQMMGGDIELESEYGTGSTFTVRIPVHVQEMPETEAAGRS